MVCSIVCMLCENHCCYLMHTIVLPQLDRLFRLCTIKLEPKYFTCLFMNALLTNYIWISFQWNENWNVLNSFAHRPSPLQTHTDNIIYEPNGWLNNIFYENIIFSQNVCLNRPQTAWYRSKDYYSMRNFNLIVPTVRFVFECLLNYKIEIWEIRDSLNITEHMQMKFNLVLLFLCL